MEKKFELNYIDSIEFVTDIMTAINQREIKLPLRITLEIEKALNIYYYKNAIMKKEKDDINSNI